MAPVVTRSVSSREASILQEMLRCLSGRERWSSYSVVLHDEDEVGEPRETGISEDGPLASFNVDLRELRSG